MNNIICYTKVIERNQRSQINTYNKWYVLGHRYNFMLTCDFLNFIIFREIWEDENEEAMWNWTKMNLVLDSEAGDSGRVMTGKELSSLYHQILWVYSSWVQRMLMSAGVCVPVRHCVPWWPRCGQPTHNHNSCTAWVPEAGVHLVKPRRNWIMHRSLLLCAEENRKWMGHQEVYLRCFSKERLTCLFLFCSFLRVEAIDLTWPVWSSNSVLISHSSHLLSLQSH